jgi:hypothetical protein
MPIEKPVDWEKIQAQAAAETEAQRIQEAQKEPAPEEPLPEVDLRYSVDVSPSIPLIRRTNAILETLRDSPKAFVYKQDGYPVRVTGIDEKKPRIELLTANKLYYEASKNLRCYKKSIDKNGQEETIDVDPPLRVIQNAISAGDFPLYNINGIIRHPTITRNGKVIYDTGYDYDTGLFLVPHESAILIAMKLKDAELTDENIKKASIVLTDMVDEFPFVSLSDRANAIAAFLTVLCRPLIQGLVPAFLFQAPSAGTGKTLLADVLLYAIMREKSEHIRLSTGDDDEIEKKLVSLLMNGGEYIFFDNIPEKLKSETLCLAITSGYFQARLLGKNEMIKLPVKCPIFLTGNNPKPNNEMARRLINIRLDANTERPWERKGFKIKDRKKHTLENHAVFIAAGLTLARAWFIRGQKPGQYTLGSFEEWAETIGGILDLAGIPGFMGNAEAFFQDTVEANWTAFVETWHDQYGEEPVLAKDLMQIALETELADEKTTANSFARYLGQKRNQIIAGFKIMKTSSHGKARQWYLQTIKKENQSV